MLYVVQYFPCLGSLSPYFNGGLEQSGFSRLKGEYPLLNTRNEFRQFGVNARGKRLNKIVGRAKGEVAWELI